MNKKEKIINVAGLCISCRNRTSCNLTRSTDPLIDLFNIHIGARGVTDAEIVIYSCDNYEIELEKNCGETDMCMFCHQEE